MKNYTATYQRGGLINGRRGWNYEVRAADGRVVAAGWTAGGRHEAVIEAKRALRACANKGLTK